jgi:hypothetical protein
MSAHADFHATINNAHKDLGRAIEAMTDCNDSWREAENLRAAAARARLFAAALDEFAAYLERGNK